MKIRLKISRDLKENRFRFFDMDFEDRPRIGDEVRVGADDGYEDKLTPAENIDPELDLKKGFRVRLTPLAVTWVPDEDGSAVPIMEALVLG